ncbi:MAG TPA: phage tail tube protein [Acidimicrobiales bacterium]|nr:phage tail tube protein [Acidimicrobiales bacterium]
MANPIPVAVSSSYLGIAKEATAGTGVTPTNYIPVLNPQDHDIVNYQFDEGLRGSLIKNYGVIAGTTESEFGWDGNVHTDAIGWPLAGILGDVVTTGASAPYTHTIGIKNNGQPKSYTLTDFYGVTQARQYAFQRFTELTLKYNADGLLTYSAKTIGAASTQVSAPTESYSALTAQPGWVVTASIAGASSLLYMSGEVALKRPATAIHVASGAQAPVAVFLGALEVTGKMSLIMPDDNELVRYLTNTQPAVVLSYTTGASSTTEVLTVQMTKCAYTNAQKNYGKDFVVLDVDITGNGNTTDVGATGGYGEVLVTVENALASGTYV